MAALIQLYRTMSRARRGQLALTMAVMLMGAAAELVTVGALIPFLALVASPGGGAGWRPAAALLERFGDPVAAAAVLLAAAALAAALMRVWLVVATQRFVTGLGHDLSTGMFARTLRQPYEAFLRRNSSEMLAGMEKVRVVVLSLLQPAMQAFTAAIIAASIAILLFVIQPAATGLAAGGLILLYFAAMAATRARLRRSSASISQTTTARMKVAQEALGGIRDVMLDRAQPLFEESFRRLDAEQGRAVAANVIIGAAPRYAIEGIGIAALALVALAASGRPGGLADAIPVLGALALGAQRLLPLVQQVYLGWSQAAGNNQALKDVLALLETPVRPLPEVEAPLPFEREVRFDGVGFTYGEGAPVFTGFDLVIGKGERVALAGRTGSGKSTMLDLLMGLIEPTEGVILVDGVALDASTRAAWQAQIAHVPQAIYLSDDSIAANIAFAVPAGEVDIKRVEDAAARAEIAGFIEALPEGYATKVGERGVRLSGGQRQRIGIARALYKRASLLILDEATSALDAATEAEVLNSVSAMGERLTVVMVTHREAALSGFRVVRLGETGAS
jgi:ABC-type multidrug transport system fused ATPase/permease subunit